MVINSELEKEIISLIQIFKNNLYDKVIEKAIILHKQNKNISVFPNLIGASYAGKNDHKNAIVFYKQALDLDYSNTEIINNLGKSQIALNLYDEAEINFKRSLALVNNNYDTLFNLGIINYNKNKFEKSLDYYFSALKLNDNVDKIKYNIGIVLSRIGKNKESINFFLQTLKLNSKHIKALNNLGIQYINDNKFDLAIYYLNKAINIHPTYAKAYNNLGAVYLQKKDYDLALKNFNKAFKLDRNLIISGIQKHFLKRMFCDWSEENELNSILANTINTDDQVSPWFCLSMEDNRTNHFIRAKKFSKQFTLIKKNQHKYNNKKIRIGYYAADFHQHAGMINMEGIFKNHNRDEFEILGFYYGDIKIDKMHKKIKKNFDKFFYINDFDDEEILKLSIENKIDIAIYRAGLTINARSSIFSHKVAPIQINFLGYPGTTGQEGIDYIIGDRYVIPKDHENCYTEKIIFLTECYYPRDNNRVIGNKIFKREDYNIPQNSFVFCSFNNSYKITKQEFEIWIELLRKVKDSTLLLLATDEKTKINLLNNVNKKNVSTDRIIFINKTNLEDHLARHSLADLFLDSFNCNAHTSAVDALWSELPILTKEGNSFASRICGSLLSHFKLDIMIAKNKEEYFDKAVKLATNPKFYRSIKDKIIEAKLSNKYFDTKKYTLNLEKAYKKIHEMRINENKVENIYIKDVE